MKRNSSLLTRHIESQEEVKEAHSLISCDRGRLIHQPPFAADANGVQYCEKRVSNSIEFSFLDTKLGRRKESDHDQIAAPKEIQ